jgi:CRP/FNR family transcriptional regulator
MRKRQAESQQALESFLNLSNEGQQLLNQDVSYANFEDPSDVIHKGQAVSGAYLVLSGQLRVYTFTPQGNEATLYFIRPGETCVLALNCLFNDLRYPAWVEASPNTDVAVISGALYRKLFSTEQTIQDMTVKALSTIVFRLMNELEEIHSCNLNQRLASFLLNNASSQGEVAMTQQILADHLGTTREVIARLMQQLTAQELVSTKRGIVTIKDTHRLTAIISPNTVI